jgi:hypothetical protein
MLAESLDCLHLSNSIRELRFCQSRGRLIGQSRAQPRLNGLPRCPRNEADEHRRPDCVWAGGGGALFRSVPAASIFVLRAAFLPAAAGATNVVCLHGPI